MKRIFPILLVLPLLAVCGKSEQAAVPVQAETKVPVRIARVHERNVISRLKISGDIAPLWKIDILSDAAGRIIEKKAQLGERVQKGQVLARLVQDIPGMEYRPVDIDAPASGVIIADMVEAGAMVTLQRPLYTMAKLDSVLVNARILESDWGKLRAGSRCIIQADALSGRRFNGRVRRLLPQVDARTRTATAEIVVSNHDLLLYPGMSVDCEFETGSRRALALPLDALIRSGAGYRAARIIGGRTRFVTLAAGEIIDQEIVISGSIALDDTVVVYGQNLLQEGSAVVIVD